MWFVSVGVSLGGGVSGTKCRGPDGDVTTCRSLVWAVPSPTITAGHRWERALVSLELAPTSFWRPSDVVLPEWVSLRGGPIFGEGLEVGPTLCLGLIDAGFGVQAVAPTSIGFVLGAVDANLLLSGLEVSAGHAWTLGE